MNADLANDRNRTSSHGPWLKLLLGPVVAAAIWSLPAPGALAGGPWVVLGLAAWMVLWWMMEPVGRAVPSLLPLVVLPMGGVMSLKEVAPAYAHPLLLLMFGGFVMGAGMEAVGLHQRMASALVRPAWIRKEGLRVMGALMLACALLSGLVSNTATVLMLMPMALCLAAAHGPGARASFAMALAYAASIGGMSTLVGTPPNLVLAGVREEFLGASVGFAEWMWIGVPAMVLLLPLAWMVVRLRGPGIEPRQADAWAPQARTPWSGAERQVAVIIALALLAWLTRTPKELGAVRVPGWGDLVTGTGSSLDAMVAIAAAIALFSLRRGRGPALTWERFSKGAPWSVWFLIGGGFALAKAFQVSGLTEVLAGVLTRWADAPPTLTLLFILLGMTFLTELTSNTATAQVVLPVLAVGAEASGIPPMMWMVPATLAASCAFMMPVATAPNALAVEQGELSVATMARTGLWLNLGSALVLWGLGVYWVPIVLGS